VCDVLVMFCVVLFVLLCWKIFTCLDGRSVVGVAGEVSDLSRGAGLLLFGRSWGVWGLGSVGVPCLGYWGISKASKILLGDMAYS